MTRAAWLQLLATPFAAILIGWFVRGSFDGLMGLLGLTALWLLVVLLRYPYVGRRQRRRRLGQRRHVRWQR